jgi:hypothetical protein
VEKPGARAVAGLGAVAYLAFVGAAVTHSWWSLLAILRPLEYPDRLGAIASVWVALRNTAWSRTASVLGVGPPPYRITVNPIAQGACFGSAAEAESSVSSREMRRAQSAQASTTTASVARSAARPQSSIGTNGVQTAEYRPPGFRRSAWRSALSKGAAAMLPTIPPPSSRPERRPHRHPARGRRSGWCDDRAHHIHPTGG